MGMAQVKMRRKWDKDHTEEYPVTWKFDRDFTNTDDCLYVPGSIRVCKTCRGSRDICRCDWRRSNG